MWLEGSRLGICNGFEDCIWCWKGKVAEYLISHSSWYGKPSICEGWARDCKVEIVAEIAQGKIMITSIFKIIYLKLLPFIQWISEITISKTLFKIMNSFLNGLIFGPLEPEPIYQLSLSHRSCLIFSNKFFKLTNDHAPPFLYFILSFDRCLLETI